MTSSSQPGNHRVEGILFDFGGVVVGSPFEAFAAIEAKAGAPHGLIRAINSKNPDTNAWAQLERGQIDLAQFVAEFEAEAAALGTSIDARAVISSLIDLPASERDARPVVLDAVRRYRSQGLRVGLLTNNIAPMSGRGPTAWVAEEFDVVVESCQIGMRKPEPGFYALACAQLGTDPRRTAFLDDLGINLKPARALGMHTVKVVDPTEAIAALDTLVRS